MPGFWPLRSKPVSIRRRRARSPSTLPDRPLQVGQSYFGDPSKRGRRTGRYSQPSKSGRFIEVFLFNISSAMIGNRPLRCGFALWLFLGLSTSLADYIGQYLLVIDGLLEKLAEFGTYLGI